MTRRIKIKKRSKKVRTRTRRRVNRRRKLNKKNTDPCLKQIMTLEELQNSNCLKFYNVTPLDDPKLQKFIEPKYTNLKDYIETNHKVIYKKNEKGCFELVKLEEVKLIKDPSPSDYFIIVSLGQYIPDYDEDVEDITEETDVRFKFVDTIDMTMDKIYYDINDKTCYTYQGFRFQHLSK